MSKSLPLFVSGCYGHGVSLMSFFLTANIKIHTQPAFLKMPDFVIRQKKKKDIWHQEKLFSDPHHPSSSTLTSASLPPWTNTLACHFPAVLSQTSNSKQGEKLTLDLFCLLQGMFSNSFQQCQGTMGHGNCPVQGLQQ